MADTLEIAQAGDSLSGADIQASIDALRRMANDMEALKTDSVSVEDLQAIGRTQADLLAIAGQLANMRRPGALKARASWPEVDPVGVGALAVRVRKRAARASKNASGCLAIASRSRW